MAGGEKKGMFGKLFGRKEKTEDTKPETRKAQTRRPPTKSGKENTQQAANSRVTKDSSPKESKKDSAPKESKKSDAVELELDIPEHEISTVALSVEDLDVSLAPEDHPVATSSPSEEQPVSPQVSPDRDESKAADTTIKLDSAPPTAAEEHVPAPEKSAPGIPTDQEPSRSSEHRPAASQDVPTDVPARDDDDFEIQLDSGEDEPQPALAQEEPQTTPVVSPAPVEVEPEPVSASSEEADAEQAEVVPESVEDDITEPIEAEPGVPPLAVADIPLVGELLSAMTPDMVARSETLAQVVQTCQTPMCVQVHGEPGSGKTSLLHAVEIQLTDRVLPLWLSARDYVGFGPFGAVSWPFLEGFVVNLQKTIPGSKDADFSESAQQIRRHLRIAAQAQCWSTDPELLSSSTGQPSSSRVGEAVSELTGELNRLVDRGLKLAAAEKLCVFVDNVHRLDAITAMEIMEAVHRFLALDKCVVVTACDSEALSRGAVLRYPGEAGDDGRAYLERFFQLSIKVPAEHGAMGPRIQSLLSHIDFPYSEEGLQDYVRLQRSSIGSNPRREKLVINRLKFLSSLRPDVCGESGDEDPETGLSRKVLFGLICLETAFPAVFRLLLSVLPHERDFALLLQEGLRAREEVLSLDEDFSLFPKGSDREDRSQRLIDFVDCLADILLKGDRNTRLDKEKIHLLSDLLRLVVATGPSAADWPEDDSRSLALTEFCRRVIDRVEGLLGKGAPDVFDRRIRMQSSGNAWCALRYSADNIKAAWGPGRLFYELSFSPENVASVRLKCDTARAMELGVLPHAIEGLNDLPLVRQGRFHFKDYGNGLVEISTAVQECSCRSVSELVADEVERVAVALQDLVAATSDLFDLPQQGLTPGPPQSAEPPQVLCKICNTPLERMLLKDGSQAYKCTTCSKIFKPKPAAKPAT